MTNTKNTVWIYSVLRKLSPNYILVNTWGSFLTSKPTWTSHLENLGKRVASGASVLFKLQTFAAVHLLRIAYFSLVYSHRNYGILNWAAANWSSSADLVNSNKRSIRSLLKVTCRDRIPLRDLFYSARILQSKDVYNYELAKHAYRIYHNTFPDYITNGFNIFATTKSEKSDKLPN